jgi:hypothetical protein
MKLIIALLISCSLIQVAQASETDNFTKRDLEVDAREWLNEQMNAAIQQAVQTAAPGDPTSIHKQLFKNLGGLFWAKIEHWDDHPESPAHKLPIEESIFRDVGEVRGQGNIIRKLFKFKNYYSPGRYRMDEVVFGADKLGHFLQVGYAMYLAVMRKENPKFKDARPFYVRAAEYFTGDRKFSENSNLRGEDLVLAYSRYQENTSWGMEGPMARSFGDMAANLEGYRFWSEFTGGKNPIVKMDSNGKWKQVRTFDWANYVNIAWDEAVNRTDYHEVIREKVEARIKEVLGESCKGLPSCTAVFDRYGKAAAQIFNLRCESLFQ